MRWWAIKEEEVGKDLHSLAKREHLGKIREFPREKRDPKKRSGNVRSWFRSRSRGLVTVSDQIPVFSWLKRKRSGNFGNGVGRDGIFPSRFHPYAGELCIFVLREKKGFVAAENRVELLQRKRKSLGPDHTAPNVVNLLNQPSQVQGRKPLSSS
jgi:hypothetical protein